MAIKTALVVDDSRLARLTLARLLERRNIRVEQAESGHAAIDYLRDHRPDVVFMDYQMPDMDGIEAIGTIAANPATAGLPVYLFTAEEGEEIRSRARSVGAQGLLLKPTPEDLLDRVLEQAAAAPARVPTASVAPGPVPVDVQAQVRDSLAALLGQAEEQRLVPLVRKTAQEAVEARLTQLWPSLLGEVRKAAQEAARSEIQGLGQQLEQEAVAAAQRTARELTGATRQRLEEVEANHRAGLGQELDRRLRQVLEGPQFQERLRTLVRANLEETGQGAVRAVAVAAEHSLNAQVRQAVDQTIGKVEAGLLAGVDQRLDQRLASNPAPRTPAALWVLAGLALVAGGAALALVLI